jgi:hypothetical protein
MSLFLGAGSAKGFDNQDKSKRLKSHTARLPYTLLDPKKRTRAAFGSGTVLQICALLAKVTTECGSATSVYDPLLTLKCCHFNLTVEMPLKAIIRGYKWGVVPTGWNGRDKGVSKFKIKEMGSRYMFIILYLWLERLLCRKDYYRNVL